MSIDEAIQSDMIEDDGEIIDWEQWVQTLTAPARAALASMEDEPSPMTASSPAPDGVGEQSQELAAAMRRLTDTLERVSLPTTRHSLPPEALSREAAATFLGVSVPTIEHLIRTRRLQYVQLGSQRGRVVPVEALRKLLQDHTQLTGEEELRRRRGRR